MDFEEEIHNQYYAEPARQEYWMHGSNSIRSSKVDFSSNKSTWTADNGLALRGSTANVGFGGTTLTSSSTICTTTNRYTGYSGCAGPQGSAGYSGIGGYAGPNSATSRQGSTSYKNLSGISNFSSSSRKPAISSMGNNVKR